MQLSLPLLLVNPAHVDRAAFLTNEIGECRSEPVAREPAAQEDLMLAHLPQVRMVAKGIWERTRFAVELDDLIGYGTLGLIDAIRKYDSSRGILLKTYAEHRIRGAILDGLRGMDWLSRGARQKERRLRRSQPHENLAVAADHAENSDLVEADSAAEDIRRQAPQFDSVIFGGGSGEMEKFLLAAGFNNLTTCHDASPYRAFERKEAVLSLLAAIATLPARLQQVLDLYYHREMSMKQIAEKFGVHESRVSQLHLEAINRLRKSLGRISPRGQSSVPRIPVKSLTQPVDEAMPEQEIALAIA